MVASILGVRNLLRPLSRLFSTGRPCKTDSNLRLEPHEFFHESIFTEEHAELRSSLNKLINRDINPFVDEWEHQKRFPAHELFKKLGSAGFFGVNKPTKYGGLGLDYSFSVAMAEELGTLSTDPLDFPEGLNSVLCNFGLNSYF